MYTYKIYKYNEIIKQDKELYNYMNSNRTFNNIHTWYEKLFSESKKWIELNNIPIEDTYADFTNFIDFSKIKYQFPKYKDIYIKGILYDNIKGQSFCLDYYNFKDTNYETVVKSIEKNNALWFLKLSEDYSFGGYDVFPILADGNMALNIKKSIQESKKYKKYKEQSNYTLQKGVDKPLLLNGYKFDIRVYLLVTSVNNKISFFVSKYNLIRKSGQKYSESIEKEVQLTNTTFNRKTNELFSLTELYDENHKYYYLNNKIIKLCKKLKDIYKHKFISEKPRIYLFGIDVIFDMHENIYLLEANISPAIYISDNEIINLHKNLEKYIFMEYIENTFEYVLQGNVKKSNFGNFIYI